MRTAKYNLPFVEVLEDGKDIAELYYSEDGQVILVSSSSPFPRSVNVGTDEENAFPHRRKISARKGIIALKYLTEQLFGCDPGWPPGY